MATLCTAASKLGNCSSYRAYQLQSKLLSSSTYRRVLQLQHGRPGAPFTVLQLGTNDFEMPVTMDKLGFQLEAGNVSDYAHWVGDPCFPVPWVSFDCTDNRVTFMDLSGMNLGDFITSTIADLTALSTLDLSNNTFRDPCQVE